MASASPGCEVSGRSQQRGQCRNGRHPLHAGRALAAAGNAGGHKSRNETSSTFRLMHHYAFFPAGALCRRGRTASYYRRVGTRYQVSMPQQLITPSLLMTAWQKRMPHRAFPARQPCFKQAASALGRPSVALYKDWVQSAVTSDLLPLRQRTTGAVAQGIPKFPRVVVQTFLLSLWVAKARTWPRAAKFRRHYCSIFLNISGCVHHF